MTEVNPSVAKQVNNRDTKNKHDELDLIEVCSILWKGRLILLLGILVAGFIGASIAFSRQDIWAAKSRISPPQVYDMYELSQQIALYTPLFERQNNSEPKVVEQDLQNLADANVLFQRFINTFNSTKNKNLFLVKFNLFKEQENGVFFVDASPENKEIFKLSKALEDNPFLDLSVLPTYELTIKTSSQQNVDETLNQYIQFTRQRVIELTLENLEALVAIKKKELMQMQSLFMDQAAQYQNSVTQLGQETRLVSIRSKLKLLDSSPVNKQIEFRPYHTLDLSVATPEQHTPRRGLIIILSVLIGAICSSGYLLIRYVFRGHLNK